MTRRRSGRTPVRTSASPWPAFALASAIAVSPLAAAAQFPTTPLLDDFDRNDGPLARAATWAEAWRFFGGVEADRSHAIEDGEIRSRNGGGSPAESGASAWLPLVAADVEAYVTFRALPTPPAGTGRGSEIQVRTQSLPDGHLDYYSCELMVNATPPDDIHILWQRGERDQVRVAGAELGDEMAPGDVFGVRIQGDRLECWRVHATGGGGFAAGEAELMLAADMPGGLGPGYIVLRTTDTADIRWDDFGGGRHPVSTPEPAACRNGEDDDADGLVDFAGGDPGCASRDDATEKDETGAFPCDDALDNDLDGLVDYVLDADADGIADPPGDPACRHPRRQREHARCQDGRNNDRRRGTDFDGGASILGAGSVDPKGADPACVGRPWRNKERGKGRRRGR